MNFHVVSSAVLLSLALCPIALAQSPSALLAPIPGIIEAAPPSNIIEFHADQAYYSGVALRTVPATECAKWSDGKSTPGMTILAPSPKAADGKNQNFTGMSYEGDLLQLTASASDGASYASPLSVDVRGTLALSAKVAAQIAMEPVIGVALDLFAPSTVPGHIVGGEAYLITSKDQAGNCHGIVLNFVPEPGAAAITPDTDAKAIKPSDLNVLPDPSTKASSPVAQTSAK